MKEPRYTVESRSQAFSTVELYSIRDNKDNKDNEEIELEFPCDKYGAIDICRQLNDEDRQGLHDTQVNEASQTYRDFLESVSEDAEYGAYLDHVATPRPEEY